LTDLKVLNAITENGRNLMNKHRLRIDCCIGATKIAVDVCRYFGIEAMGLAVRAQIYNSEFIKLLDERGSQPQSMEEAKEWKRKGAHCCSIGDQDIEPLAEGMWPGHLVMIASSKHGTHLVDLTIDQANRPKKNIEVSSAHFLVPAEFALKQSCFMVGNEKGCVLTYDSYPGNRTFMQAPYWNKKRKDLRDPIIADMIRLINRMPDDPELEELPHAIPKVTPL
jgi:hypothetical protein